MLFPQNPRSTCMSGSRISAPPWSLGSNWLANYTKCQAREFTGAHLSEEGISFASLLSAQSQSPYLAPWLGIQFTRISMLIWGNNVNRTCCMPTIRENTDSEHIRILDYFSYALLLFNSWFSILTAPWNHLSPALAGGFFTLSHQGSQPREVFVVKNTNTYK